jgi:hypothetical protein
VRNPEPSVVAALISKEVARTEIRSETDEHILDFPNHYWSHAGLIEEVVGELRALGMVSKIVIALDCSLASSKLRHEAGELKKRTRTELVLKNFGSGPNELVMLEQLAPVALGLSADALASLRTLNPRVTSLRTAIAIATAFNLRTISFEQLDDAQLVKLAELGIIEFVIPEENTMEKE